MEKGVARKAHFLKILEKFNVEILEVLENPQTLENKGDSDHFLEILENLEILEILELPRDPFRNDPFFRSRFDVYVFVLNLNLLTEIVVHVCVFVCFIRRKSRKRGRYVYLIQIRVFRVCVCVLSSYFKS